MIVSGVKSSEDAEYFAGLLGTRTVKKETTQVEVGFFGQTQTGMKSVRDAEEYLVHPNRLKDLQQGEVFTVSRTVDPRWAMVKVPQAIEFSKVSLDQTELLAALSKTRSHYMAASKDRYLDLAQAMSLKQGSQPTEREVERLEGVSPGPELWS